MGNLNVKDLILDEEERENISTRTNSLKHNTPVRIKPILQNGCDFALERTEGRKKSRLVVLVSQNQFYVEDDGGRYLLNRKMLSEFLKGYNKYTIELPQVSWISRLRCNRDYIRKFVQFLFNERAMYMARKGILFIPEEIDIYTSIGIAELGQRKIRDLTEDAEGYNMGHPMPFGYENPWDNPLENPTGNMHYNPMENIFDEFDNRPALCRYDPWNYYAFLAEGTNENLKSILKNLQGVIFREHGMAWACVYMHELCPSLYNYMINEAAEVTGVPKKEVLEKHIFDYSDRVSLCFQSFFSFALIAFRFGLEYGKEAIHRFLKSDIMDIIPFQGLSILLYGKNDITYAESVDYKRSNSICEFEGGRFLKYLLQESQEQGYNSRMERFLLEWADVLMIQKYLYNEIKEKYPAHLASSELKYVSIAERSRSTIYNNMWKEAAEKMLPFEYKGSKYQIVCPKSTADLVAEGNHQNNCVANYEKPILSGDTMVFFMRSTNPQTEKKPILTIELTPSGRIDQVKARFNEPPGIKQLEFVKTWAEEKGLTLDCGIFPVRFGGD